MKKHILSIALVLTLMLTLAPAAFTAGATPAFGISDTVGVMKNEAFAPASTTTIANRFLLGDINLDGERSNADLVVLARYIVGAEILNNDQLACSNLNDDDVVSNADLVFLARVLVGAEFIPDTTPTIFVSSVTASPGDDEVEVIVSVRNNPGILGMTLSVSYDESAMTLVDAANGDAVSDVLTLTKANVLKNGCNFVWDGQEITPEDIKDGAILVLSFDISDSAKSGVYPIGFSYDDGDIVDGDLLPLSISIESGNITIS